MNWQNLSEFSRKKGKKKLRRYNFGLCRSGDLIWKSTRHRPALSLHDAIKRKARHKQPLIKTHLKGKFIFGSSNLFRTRKKKNLLQLLFATRSVNFNLKPEIWCEFVNVGSYLQVLGSHVKKLLKFTLEAFALKMTKKNELAMNKRVEENQINLLMTY